MTIKRDRYLNLLIDSMHNGMVKVVTGMRRAGKSFLLFNLFYEYLKEQGNDDAHIIKTNLDDLENQRLRDPFALLEYVKSLITDKKEYYILLDEIQLVPRFEEVLNSLLHVGNADIYVTGSNAKFLSKDVITEFRGRGDQIHIHPLSFSEFASADPDKDKHSMLDEYYLYGGLPQILQRKSPDRKAEFLKSLFAETYLKDIRERNRIVNDAELDELLNIIASDIGSLTNPTKLADTFKSVKNSDITRDTIKRYLDYFEDSFLVEKAIRYNIKGKKYIDTPAKYYFCDLGLRNARLNFRQQERTHLMENLIYNELRIRGLSVDIGQVETYSKDNEGRTVRHKLEVDFVCNKGSGRWYIQSALNINDDEKYHQEIASLKRIKDSFPKILIVGNDIITRRNEDGIVMMGLLEFLLNPDSLKL
jgi:predicted AAA+ superfamily ATPase